MDPQAHDAESYLDFANAKGMEIKYVIDTHIQADHLCGGPDLSETTGGHYCLHSSADVDFAFTPLTDGQELDLGSQTRKISQSLFS